MEIESDNSFYKISSKNVLKKIFNILENGRTYEIIRYNKNIRSKLNITINDYKELSEISPIVIEINPVPNKYGKVFNYINEKSESYYHMYFDNDKEEKEGMN